MISFFLTIIIFLINGISVLRLYQIKDYLYKRVIAQFYFPSSKKILLNKKEYIIYFLFFLSLFVEKTFTLKIDFLIFLVFILFILRTDLLKKIHFTPKAVFILFSSLFFNFFILYSLNNNLSIFLFLCLWPVQFSVYTLSIKIFNFMIKPYLEFLGNQAKRKIFKIKQTNPNFKIIGICGSYGKSSTKEILVQLLSQKYKVLSPPARINHEYALIKFLLGSKIESYDYLILEFGSYYLGNIKWISKFLTPEIAYITGITKQHLFLFGSVEKIIEGEGLEVLTWMKKGIVLINNNHEYFEIFKEKYEKFKPKELKTYFYGKNYKIKEINLEKEIAIFEFKNQTFQTNLIFPMQIENLVAVLSYLSLIEDLKDFEEKIKNIQLPENFLKLRKIYLATSDKYSKNKIDLIADKNNLVLYIFEDSYNANPKGVYDSLEFFKNLDFNYKVIIFNGLLELGKETEIIYSQIAKKFLSFDKIILTSDDFFQIFKEILNEKIILIQNSTELEVFLKNLKFKKVGVWIFNKFPSFGFKTPILK